MNEVEKIISSARDKYTVHNCGECTYRKCCELGFGSADCMSRRESIFLKLGIEDGYFSKLLDDIEAAWKREKAELIYAYDPTKAGKGRLPDGSAYALEAMREPVTGCHAVGHPELAVEECYDAIAVLLRVIDVLEGRQELRRPERGDLCHEN